MEIKLYTDLFNALCKVAGGLKAIVNLPKAERETIRRTVDETYRLVDTTLIMVISLLDNRQLQASNDEPLREVARQDNYNQWMQAEREFRLCRNLPVALRETETLPGRLAGAMSTKGWYSCYGRCTLLLLQKAKLRCSSDRSFNDSLTISAAWVGKSPGPIQSERDARAAFRRSLVAELQIKQEVTLYTIV